MGEQATTDETSRTDRALLPVALTTALIVSAMGAGATVLPGPGEDLPLLVDETVEDGHAVTVSVELSGPALYRIDLIGDGPRQGSVISQGFVSYDEAGDWNGSLIVTSFQSDERQETVVSNETIPLDDLSVPDVGSTPFTAILAEDDRERPCPLSCMSRLEQPDRTEAGTFHYGLWMGGVSETRLQIVGDENVENVEVREGTPIVAGTSDFEDGTLNVQHQPTTTVEDKHVFAGAKAVHGAQFQATTEQALYGAYGLADFKRACVVVCIGLDTARAACADVTAIACRTAQASWQGPSDTGASGSHHTFAQAPAGEYTFTVEGLVDAYANDVAGPTGNAYAGVGEHHAYVSTAELPQPPLAG